MMIRKALRTLVLEAAREAHGSQWPEALTPIQVVAQTLDALIDVLVALIEEREGDG